MKNTQTQCFPRGKSSKTNPPHTTMDTIIHPLPTVTILAAVTTTMQTVNTRQSTIIVVAASLPPPSGKQNTLVSSLYKLPYWIMKEQLGQERNVSNQKWHVSNSIWLDFRGRSPNPSTNSPSTKVNRLLQRIIPARLLRRHCRPLSAAALAHAGPDRSHSSNPVRPLPLHRQEAPPPTILPPLV